MEINVEPLTDPTIVPLTDSTVEPPVDKENIPVEPSVRKPISMRRILQLFMDNNDREEIAAHLNILDANNNLIEKHINSQITINNRINDELNNLTLNINNKQKQLTSSLNNITKTTNTINKTIQKDQRKRKVKENLIVLLEKLKQVEEIILLSRLQILSRDKNHNKKSNLHELYNI